jgi:RNA polymerase sigma factor (sigma-70 family)
VNRTRQVNLEIALVHLIGVWCESDAEQFVDEAFDGLVARIDRRFRGSVSAEDAVQEALIRAWQRSVTGDHIRSWNGWVAAVANNVARSEWRRREAEARAMARYMSLIAAEPSADDWPVELRHLGPIAEAVDGLPLRQSQVVVLHYYGDLELREIAALLGVSEGTVKRSLHRARATLRTLLQAQRRQPTARRTVMQGWFMAGSHPAQYSHQLEPDVGGRRAARIWFTAQDPGGFGTLMQMFKADAYRGKRMRFSAEARTKDVDGWLGLWMRVDGDRQRSLAFDNMQSRAIKGTTDWRRYDVVLDVDHEATAVAFGVLLTGRGEGWIANVRFEPVGPEVATTGTGGGGLAEGPENLDFSQG